MSELQLRIADMSAEARDVVRLELVDVNGQDLPAFDPGAHVALKLPNGAVRQYSLLNDWRDRGRYVLGVGRVRGGRGGSESVHTELRPGMVLRCAVPVNHFALRPDATRYLFIAGGIGITPILSMIRWCSAMEKPWQLVYAARSRSRLAFYEDLVPYGERVHLHCDDEAGKALPVAQLMADAPRDADVYCCGPAPLMEAVRDSASPVPVASRHFEWFSAPASDSLSSTDGFWIDLRRSGQSLQVPPELSILEVLEKHGHEVPFSCREGVCGTCETGVCEGEVDHRDYVYSEAQREGLRSMLICVSRALSPRLVLDL
ncbi:PDR/VanB family oxidoreductase [Hydrogenophaga sp.]|uniref:PDR/VanB family oxidoreductase n=1 Tax=Hydrogenophaga sp. TaxID=1904254 RepID=UPI003F70BFB4